MNAQTQAQADHNLRLWNALAPTDSAFTKPITGKSYRGDSPNPTYVIRKLTEQLGPIGINWGFSVVEERVLDGAPHFVQTGPERGEIVREQYHQVLIEFWIIGPDGERRSFHSYGGTPMLTMTRAGRWLMDEDAAKKSLTDAYTKAASWLGSCAEIFLGIFDNKFGGEIGEQNAPPPAGNGGWSAPQGQPRQPQGAEPPPPAAPPRQNGAQRQSSAPAGW